ncbi:SMP-30/gluconolactonase/LRE family protein [Salipiger sp. PrR002]|uniref:SMP-30/gluconolactonase/LRE family protein n=1 Tax=Salipiger sp. PrR002 TaxID=2706489 RepID=UPI0013BA16B8|nr:SMP-30/gluconolactonase/LRE family protein [Salipiger sp. PrR002]NDV98807.1 SMP-30/gluconolactonase/LRE family protein [Salipiger sp. PrR002]NDW55544.1 SMP-30/gluconolactonase/LRE family protein [Salipiger sp. PrR004]
MDLFDDRTCKLGEGALWHPLRGEIFWFDITGKRLLSHHPASGHTRDVPLTEMCSAAAWIDRDRMLIASETGLWEYDVTTGVFGHLVDLEKDCASTRSNDGRADPWGGFWIGTMGKQAEHKAGAIYRYADGALRTIADRISIPNAICFDRERGCGYFADTAKAHLYRVALDAAGWPAAEPELFVDFTEHGLSPDGALTDATGALWVALWGAGAVVEVSPEGVLGARHEMPAPHATCPAFGGPDFTTLYCTTATQGLGPDALAEAPLSGKLFAQLGAGQGRAEPAFILDRGDT